MTIKDWQTKVHKVALEHGWYNPPKTPTEAIALMHSELSEALEELRNGKPLDLVYYNDLKPDKPEGFGVELADCVIRILDTCEYIGIDLEQMILLKNAYNETRPYRHGGKLV